MKRPRPKPDVAMEDAVARLVRKFEYPDRDTQQSASGGEKGGMAHILVVSDSEPPEVQAKADYIVSSVDSTGPLQSIFDTVASGSPNGPWSVWLAGRFTIDGELTVPSTMWLRGLGYTDQVIVVAI